MTERALLLDIGGVLEHTPATGWTARWELSLGLPPGAIDRRCADLWTAGAIGDMTEAQVIARLEAWLGPAAAARFLDDLWTEYLGSPNEELIAYVRTLRGRCRLGILSNSFVGAREREEAAYAFPALVDEILYSHETGLEKPDPAAYALAVDRLGVAPHNCLFVDDLLTNVTAARTAGLAAVHHTANAPVIAAIEAFLARPPSES
ncbi:HAD family hydrolase [Symbioplanes lichenis]|uniref:HAD family hydrolase n=1 Tax=Symbioplanes lichenis TaxID=1629072 RepID=UPI00273A27D4|nr:HAD family phosphatase [Actinoplanes lichenis]